MAGDLHVTSQLVGQAAASLLPRILLSNNTVNSKAQADSWLYSHVLIVTSTVQNTGASDYSRPSFGKIKDGDRNPHRSSADGPNGWGGGECATSDRGPEEAAQSPESPLRKDTPSAPCRRGRLGKHNS